MKNTALQIVAAKALPALSGCQLTYNAEKNLFLTPGNTSPAGNTYFKSLRLSDRLLIYCELGQGYSILFLNAISLYVWDGTHAKLISREEWGGCGNWMGYSEHFVKEKSIKMLSDYLKGQLKIAGERATDSEVTEYARSMVESIPCRRIG